MSRGLTHARYRLKSSKKEQIIESFSKNGDKDVFVFLRRVEEGSLRVFPSPQRHFYVQRAVKGEGRVVILLHGGSFV